MFTERRYQERGYKNRHEYLMCLARDYGVPFDTVRRLANQLGEMEDFGKLIEILQKMDEEE